MKIEYLIYIIIALLIITLFVALVLRSRLERTRILGTFKRYVAPEIVREILKRGPDKLNVGSTKNIAVLFVDIRGFTTMSEVLQPIDVVKILDRYLDLTSKCIIRNSGTLDKFIGDATMAFWGAPIEQEDCAYKAVKTAIEMLKGSKILNEEINRLYDRSISFGVGIHIGDAVVGNVGGAIRKDYTAIGDTVNTAARLESNAPSGKIYISKPVADAIEGRIEVRSLGSGLKLKGKSETIEVFEIVV